MEIFMAQRPRPSRAALWTFLVLTELFLAWTVLVVPYYSVPLFIAVLSVLVLFFYPELAYLPFVLSLGSHLFQFNITYAHSIPPRLWRMESVPVDIAALPAFLSNLLVIAASLSWLFARMAKARNPYPKSEIDMPALLFFGWHVFSLLWAPDLDTGLLKIFAMICTYLGFFLAVSIIRTKKTLTVVVWLLIGVGLINAAVAAYSLHGEHIGKVLWRFRNVSLYFNFIDMARERGMGLSYSQSTAYLLNISIMLSIAMLLIAKNLKNRVFLVLIIVFLIYGHLTCLSKAGLLGLLSGSSFIILAYKPLRRHLVLSLFIIAIVVIILGFAVYFSWPWPEKAGLFMPRRSLFPRLQIWEVGFENLVESYGFGFGCGSFYPAHSIWLGVLFDVGIIGLLLWMWLLIRLFNTLRRSWKGCQDPYYQKIILGLTGGIISILAFGLFDGAYFEETLWTLMGLSMVVANLTTRQTHGGQIPVAAAYGKG